MPVPGRTLTFAFLAFAGFLQAQGGARSTEAMRAVLPTLRGEERLATLLELANAIESREPQEALGYAVEGAALAVQVGNREKEAACLSTVAYCCSQTGDFSMGIDYGKRALALATALGNQDRMAKAHNALGITYTFIGAYSQALEESYEALHLREALGQEKAISQSLNLVGVVYHHSGQYERAIDYFQQILKRVEVQPDPKRFILAKLNIGFALYKLGRLDEALRQHQEALARAREAHEPTYDAYAHLNLGMTYSDLRQFKQAQHYLQLAHEEYLRQKQKHGLVQVLNAMARMQLLAGAFDRGVPLALEAAELAHKINARDELITSYELISTLHGRLGQVGESYRYFKLAVSTRDALHTIQESEKFAEASMRIVTLKKDNEIAALKREQVISSLKIEKQRYFSLIFASSIGFLAAIIFLLGNYNKKMRQNRKALETSNADLASTNVELQDKVNEIKTLTGLLPICAQCKKIRNDEGYWTQLEGYISEHSSATFTHGICPPCAEELYPMAMERLKGKGDARGTDQA